MSELDKKPSVDHNKVPEQPGPNQNGNGHGDGAKPCEPAIPSFVRPRTPRITRDLPNPLAGGNIS
jgi:hypothetical protein